MIPGRFSLEKKSRFLLIPPIWQSIVTEFLLVKEVLWQRAFPRICCILCLVLVPRKGGLMVMSSFLHTWPDTWTPPSHVNTVICPSPTFSLWHFGLLNSRIHPKRKKKYKLITLQGRGIDQGHLVMSSMFLGDNIKSSRHLHLIDSNFGQLGRIRNAQHVRSGFKIMLSHLKY